MNKVLLIDPAGDSFATFRNILDRDDLRIFTAATAEEGVMIHREEMVDLILTDLDLPDMGGGELCSLIRREPALRKVSIIVVCRDVPEEIARADGCGANGRLVKPVSPEQLDECVGKLLAVPARQDCRVLVRAQLYGEYGTTTLYCTTRDISISGLLLESDELLAIGDRISCLFFLPGALQVSAVGEIVRTSTVSRLMKLYGVRFISLNPQARTEIELFVAASAAA